MNQIKSIYQISAEQERLNFLLEESGGEITPEIEEALVITKEAMVAKAEDYINAIKASEAIANIARIRVRELEALESIQKKKVTAMKKALANAMETFGYNKLPVGLFTLSFRASSIVEVEDETKVPARFTKVSTTVDKIAIKEALKRGEYVAGATLSTRKNLQIK